MDELVRLTPKGRRLIEEVVVRALLEGRPEEEVFEELVGDWLLTTPRLKERFWSWLISSARRVITALVGAGGGGSGRGFSAGGPGSTSSGSWKRKAKP